MPESVVQLKGKKKLIAFLDGDRGGDLIQKELEQMLGDIPIYRASPGKEVEELTPAEIKEILEGQKKPAPAVEIDSALLEKVKSIYPSLKETLEAVILDGNLTDGQHIIIDGTATQRLIDAAKSSNYTTIIAFKKADGIKVPEGMKVYTFSELGLS